MVADELLKLSQLRDAGVLSDEEFQAQKRALLQGPPTGSSPLVSGGTASPAVEEPERVFFEDAATSVLVSSRRIVLGALTFVTANVSSVSLTSDEAAVRTQHGSIRVLGLLMALAGGGMLFATVTDLRNPGWCAPAAGVVTLLGLGMCFSPMGPITYSVAITGGGGNNTPLQSSDRAYVERVVAAITAAITK
jgi:hypothetical protein